MSRLPKQLAKDEEEINKAKGLRRRLRIGRVRHVIPNHLKGKEWIGTVAKIIQGMQYTGVNPMLQGRTIMQIREDLRTFVELDQFWESLQQLQESLK